MNIPVDGRFPFLDAALAGCGVRAIAVGDSCTVTPRDRAEAVLRSRELTLQLDLRELGRQALRAGGEVARWQDIVAEDEIEVERARAALAEIGEAA